MTPPARPYAELIGDPVEQSVGPRIHAFWLDALGIDAEYGRRRVARGELRAYLDAVRADPMWRGCNVTMPLKLDALAAADHATDRALGTGAANVLMMREGRLVAANTDVGAIIKILHGLYTGGAPMGSVTLLGSGGAARAALMGLHQIGLRSIRIESRDMAEAYKIAVQHGLELEPVPFGAPVETDGLINATPLGMAGQPSLAIDLKAMPAKGWVVDYVTNPNPTPLLADARERGLAAVSGLSLLIEQAADSFKLLFDRDAPRDRDAALLERLAA